MFSKNFLTCITKMNRICPRFFFRFGTAATIIGRRSNVLITATRPNFSPVIIERFRLARRWYQASPSMLDDKTPGSPNDPTEPDPSLVQRFLQDHQVVVKNARDQRTILNFSQLAMPDQLRSLMERLGYSRPTPIQAQSLPVLCAGQDLIGIAQTGSGKTLAYLLPAMIRFYDIHRDYWSQNGGFDQRLKPKVLILAPTRELAVQIFEVIRQFRIFKSICLYGGNDRKKQINFLEDNNPLFLVSTPGRLKDLVDSEFVDLSGIEYLVVDEADRMLDMGFEPQISYLIDRCPGVQERQTAMFSATWPDEVRHLVNKYLKPDHAFISIGGTKLVANHNIKQEIIVCPSFERSERLQEILNQHRKDKVLVFCNTKRDCDNIAKIISRKFRLRSAPLHGDMSQRQREGTLKDFKSGEIQVLCATNVAARGLDIDDINIVINYDFPDDIETYVHRIGRTGRKENKGLAYSFFATDRDANGSLARDLIDILGESGNDIPEELDLLAQQRSYGKPAARKQFRQGQNHRKFWNKSYQSPRHRY